MGPMLSFHTRAFLSVIRAMSFSCVEELYFGCMVTRLALMTWVSVSLLESTLYSPAVTVTCTLGEFEGRFTLYSVCVCLNVLFVVSLSLSFSLVYIAIDGRFVDLKLNVSVASILIVIILRSFSMYYLIYLYFHVLFIISL